MKQISFFFQKRKNKKKLNHQKNEKENKYMRNFLLKWARVRSTAKEIVKDCRGLYEKVISHLHSASDVINSKAAVRTVRVKKI